MATSKLTSKVFTGAYNTEWATKATAIFRTQYLPKVYNVYGEGVRTVDLLQAAGQVMYNLPNATINHFERYAPQYNITLADSGSGNGIDTGTGDITFKISTSDYDDNDNPPIRTGDTIEVPATYMPTAVNTGRLYRIESNSGSGTDLTFTARPISADGTYLTATQISTAVPVGTVLGIRYTPKAPGTGQPTGRTDSFAYRSHVSAILKESGNYEGGQMAQAFEEAIAMEMRSGNPGILIKPVLEVESRLENQIEAYIVTGERQDNTSLVETSSFGGTPTVKSGFGFIQWADQLAQAKYYTTSYSIDDFDDNKLLLQTQGITSKMCSMLCGPQIFLDLENAGLEWVREYSGGTNLLNAQQNLGITIASIKKAGIEYYPVELGSFANPTTFGLNVSDTYIYNYPTSALIIPMENNAVRMNGKDVSIPSMTLGYVNNNGEDRSRVVGIEAGPNKVFPTQFVANDKDGWNVHMFTEVMVICTNVNRWIYVRKSK